MEDLGFDTYGVFIWREKRVFITDSAGRHLRYERISPYELMDMINDTVECPEYRRFKRNEIEICSKKHRKTYRIILIDGNHERLGIDCWWVKHVEPT